MRIPKVSNWIFSTTGGIFHWSIKGFKTKLNEELSEQNLPRNNLAGTIVIILLVLISVIVTKNS